VALAEDDDVVEELAADGADEPLDIGVGTSCRLRSMRAKR